MEGDGSACGTLFSDSDSVKVQPPFGGYPIATPTDTLQAAFNIAQHPTGADGGYNESGTDDPTAPFALVTPASPFQPVLTAKPNDWSISLNYTGGGGLSSASAVGSFAMDAMGNLWITDTQAGNVIEWNAIGAALSPSTGFAAGGGPLAVDANGNVWISGDNKLAELTNLGMPYPGSPFPGVAGGGNDIVIDAQSNLWITNGSGCRRIYELRSAAIARRRFTNSGITDTSRLVIDSSNNVWVGYQPSSSFLLASAHQPRARK